MLWYNSSEGCFTKHLPQPRGHPLIALNRLLFVPFQQTMVLIFCHPFHDSLSSLPFRGFSRCPLFVVVVVASVVDYPLFDVIAIWNLVLAFDQSDAVVAAVVDFVLVRSAHSYVAHGPGVLFVAFHHQSCRTVSL